MLTAGTLLGRSAFVVPQRQLQPSGPNNPAKTGHGPTMYDFSLCLFSFTLSILQGKEKRKQMQVQARVDCPQLNHAVHTANEELLWSCMYATE